MKIAILAGSNRNGSTSSRLAHYVENLIRTKGSESSLIDLRPNPLPFYSPDESYESHAGVAELNQTMLEAHAIVLATPEYHGSMSGVLKNALDHLGQEHFSGKVVLSMSAAGGPVGVSSLQHMQAVVRNLHGINAPEWISIGGNQSFGQAVPQAADERIHRVVGQFLALAETFHSRSNPPAAIG